MSSITLSSPKWLRFICIHNPFYLISACLVLYGLHISFNGPGGAGAGWQLMAYLCGYATLLLLAATLVVRFGRVWEDARMILLLTVLIFVAISAGFDRVCLDSPTSGARFLAAGFGFAVLLTELTLLCLAIRLPARYRIPFYLQLGLLFELRKQMADMIREKIEPYEIARRGLVDDIIDPRETRNVLIRGLDMTRNKHIERPWRRHAVGP